MVLGAGCMKGLTPARLEPVNPPGEALFPTLWLQGYMPVVQGIAVHCSRPGYRVYAVDVVLHRRIDRTFGMRS